MRSSRGLREDPEDGDGGGGGTLHIDELIAAAAATTVARIVLAVLVGAFALAALVTLFLTLRRRLLRRGSGTIGCALRVLRSDHGDGAWTTGIARYEGDHLLWHRAFGVTLRPRHVISRRELVITGRRQPDGREALELPGTWTVIGCRTGQRNIELAMGEATLTGFLAWLESSPPGTHIDHIT